jgi:hypothetical protein
VYLVQECSVKSCNDGGEIGSALLPSFSYSLPSLPVVSRPQANHPHVDVDPTCFPSVKVSYDYSCPQEVFLKVVLVGGSQS